MDKAWLYPSASKPTPLLRLEALWILALSLRDSQCKQLCASLWAFSKLLSSGISSFEMCRSFCDLTMWFVCVYDQRTRTLKGGLSQVANRFDRQITGQIRPVHDVR